METKFNFKSQICTDKNQSERLLALGLRKETADMRWANSMGNSSGTTYYLEVGTPYYDCDIPAWSLHRLIEMINEEIQTDWESMCLQDQGFTTRNNLYDNFIDCIKWLIKEGYFNEEYLEE